MAVGVCTCLQTGMFGRCPGTPAPTLSYLRNSLQCLRRLNMRLWGLNMCPCRLNMMCLCRLNMHRGGDIILHDNDCDVAVLNPDC